MLEYTEDKVLPYTTDQLFDLVADVDRYPDFLPWCIGARVKTRTETRLIADLVIGFKMVRERFTSEVSLDRAAGRIDTRMLSGPFTQLENHWTFENCGTADAPACRLRFRVAFAFRSKLLQKLIGPVFGEAQKKLVGAFEDRARVLYGN